MPAAILLVIPLHALLVIEVYSEGATFGSLVLAYRAGSLVKAYRLMVK